MIKMAKENIIKGMKKNILKKMNEKFENLLNLCEKYYIQGRVDYLNDNYHLKAFSKQLKGKVDKPYRKMLVNCYEHGKEHNDTGEYNPEEFKKEMKKLIYSNI